MRVAGLSVALALLLLGAFASVDSVRADEHDEVPFECVVGEVVIDCDDEGISGDHGVNCDVVHYHGDLNGKPDPDEYGCGHGEVFEQDVTPEEEEDSGYWETFTDWADALFQGVSGGFSPKNVSDSVDIVVDASEGMAETAENANEYFDANPDAPGRERYTLENEGGEHGWLYNTFWGWFE